MKHPLSLEAFADWLGTKSGSYSYTDNHRCAVCQYFDHIGLPFQAVYSTCWLDPKGKWHSLPKGFNHVANGGVRNTFKEAHKRAIEFSH